MGGPEEGGQKDYRRVHLTGRFRPHGALWSRIWGAGAPQAGVHPDLASGGYSHLSPSVTLGIRPSLLGLQVLDSGDRGGGAERGGAKEPISQSGPSSAFPLPPGDRGRDGVQSKG